MNAISHESEKGFSFPQCSCCSFTESYPTLCNPIDCSMPAPLSSTISQSFFKFMSISKWCYITISSSDTPFFCLQSFPVSGSFPMSQFFPSGGQSIGVSASVSILLVNIQDWFPLGWTDWISLSPRDSQEFSPTPQFKSINSSVLSFLYSPTLTSILAYWKNNSFD